MHKIIYRDYYFSAAYASQKQLYIPNLELVEYGSTRRATKTDLIKPGMEKGTRSIGTGKGNDSITQGTDRQLEGYNTISVSERHRESNVIYYAFHSRLGNCLFGLASTLGIGFHNNRSTIFIMSPQLANLKELYPKVNMAITQNLPNITLIREKSIRIFSSEVFNLNTTAPVRVATFLQSFKYFNDVFDVLYQQIFSQWNSKLLSKAKTFIHNAEMKYLKEKGLTQRVAKVTTVCLHVRRGDFLSEQNTKKGRQVAPAEDLINAMRYIETKFNHTIFIVASNSIEWCQKHLNKHNVYFSQFESANQDFTLISNCDHMIMTVGTFGWWAGWLTSWRGGIAMYYQQLFGKKTPTYRSCNRHDFIPADWLAYTSSSITRSGDLGNNCD